MKSGAYSLRLRLLMLLGALLTLGLGVQAALSYKVLLDESEEIFDYQMVQVAQILARGDDLAETLPRTREDGEDLQFYLQVWDAGELEYASDRRNLMPRQAQAGFAETLLAGDRLRIYTEIDGDMQVQVGQDLGERYEVAREVALESAWPMLLVAFSIVLATALIVTLALRPLTRLQAELALRKPGEMMPLEMRGMPAEIVPLAEATNALMARMERAYEQQRQFVSDAAHELRTPLTALLLQNEAIRQADEPTALNEAIAEQRQGIQRAARLVEQLLLLARQEATGEDGTDFDAGKTLKPLLEEYAPLAAKAGIRLALIEQQPLRVRGSLAAFAAVMRNLLDNAIKYTPAGGVVEVHIATDIRVEDSGPGIPETERARVFDRFYRMPGSPGQGSGLGLAIAQTAAASLGAQLHLQSSALGGLAAVLKW
ncbi:two-component sensor histidine kinase [Lysobacteraceae bacterium NML120232]|nr:two-component sensor histidine kinase [Xanthomonadaceae bacterium NML120232]